MDAIRGASPRSSNPSTAERFPAQDANQNSDVGTKPKQGGAIAPPSASRSMAPPANGSSIAAPQSGNSNAPANGSSIAAPQTPASNAPSTGSKIAPPQARSQDASRPGPDTARQGDGDASAPASEGSSDSDDLFQGRINGNALPSESATPEEATAPEDAETTTPTDEAADVEATGPTIPAPDTSSALPLEQQVGDAIAPALFGEVPPAAGLDFSTSTPAELGSAAVEAAEQIARLVTEGGDAADIAEAQGVIAAVASQVSANGANGLQLAEFDDLVFGIGFLTSLDIQGSPDAEAENLLGIRSAFQAGDILAFSNPTQDILDTAEGFIGPLIADAATGNFAPPASLSSAESIPDLDDEGIGAALNDLATAFAAFGTAGVPPDGSSLGSAQEAQFLYSGIREQLATDGASPEQLAELDAFVTDYAGQIAASVFDPEFSAAEITSRAEELFGPRTGTDGAPNTQIAAIAETNALRDARLDVQNALSPDRATSDESIAPELPGLTAPIDESGGFISPEDIGPALGRAQSDISLVSGVPSGNLATQTPAQLGEIAFTAGQQLGRAIAFGDQAAQTAATDVIADVRDQLVENGVNTAAATRFLGSVTTLARETAFDITDDPRADPALLESLSNDFLDTRLEALQRTDLPALQDRLESATRGSASAPPAAGLDLSSANPQELGSTAAQAAEQLGRLVGEEAEDADIEEVQGVLSAVRAQLFANGVNQVQLVEYDNFIAELTNLSLLDTVGSAFFDEAAFNQVRDILQAGGIPALSDPNPEILGSLTEAIEFQVAEGTSGNFPVPAGIDVAVFDDLAIGRSLRDIAAALGDTNVFGSVSNELTVDNLVQGLGLYGGIRDQLSADGATPEQLTELDTFITDLAIQNGLLSAGAEVTDPDIFNRADELLGPRQTQSGMSNEQIAAIAQTNDARDSRLDPGAFLSADDAQRVQDVVALALANENPAEFTGGNLSIASPGEIASLLRDAASTLATGIAEDDPEATQTGLDDFDLVRDELVRRSPGDEVPAPVVNAFVSSIALQLALLRDPSRENIANIGADLPALQIAVGDFSVEDNFGIASVRNFEGDNGADPASIFVVELKPGQGNDASTNFVGHDVAVSNVIEAQLQDAGQSYQLTNIQAESAIDPFGLATDPIARGNSVTEALNFVTDTVEQSGEPAFLNLSLGADLSGSLLTAALEAASETGLVDDLDLSVPITPDNINDFKGTIRDVALAAIDPERPEIATALGDFLRFWQGIGTEIQALERVAEANIDAFVALANSDSAISSSQFANDEGASGSITLVGNNGLENALVSDEFILPDQGEELPTTDEGINGIPTGADATFYRGEGVDVFAPGNAIAGLNERVVTGTSFATPDILVNAVLGRFNPDTETRITPSGA